MCESLPLIYIFPYIWKEKKVVQYTKIFNEKGRDSGTYNLPNRRVVYIYRPACVNTWTKSGVERKSNEPEGCLLPHIQRKRGKNTSKNILFLSPIFQKSSTLGPTFQWKLVIYERRWEIRPIVGRKEPRTMMKGETFLKAWPFCIFLRGGICTNSSRPSRLP